MAKSNVAAVQVPGEEPAKQSNDLLAEQNAEQSSDSAESATNEIQSSTPAIDLEAERAKIREEERAAARVELAKQVAAAAEALEEPPVPTTSIATSRRAYRDKNAADIDPSTLTAPVLTKDGWLCPPAPEA